MAQPIIQLPTSQSKKITISRPSQATQKISDWLGQLPKTMLLT